MNGSQAAQLLKNKKPYHFMVRGSNSSPDDFLLAISVVTKSNTIDHLKIYTKIEDDKIIYLNSLDETSDDLITSNSLIDYIAHLTNSFKVNKQTHQLKTAVSGSPTLRLLNLENMGSFRMVDDDSL